MDETIKKKISGYQKAFHQYGFSPKSLQWASRQAAEVRYNSLIKDIDFENKTVLDVGCGFANIVDFISQKTKNFKYTGVDIVPEFVRKAQENYPQYSFILQDYFSQPLPEKFDIVLTSGTLNSFMQDIEFKKKAIKTMFDQAREVCAFNMAGGHPIPESKVDGKVKYVDSLEILAYCFTLTSKIIFRHDYHLKDFTIILFR